MDHPRVQAGRRDGLFQLGRLAPQQGGGPVNGARDRLRQGAHARLEPPTTGGVGVIRLRRWAKEPAQGCPSWSYTCSGPWSPKGPRVMPAQAGRGRWGPTSWPHRPGDPGPDGADLTGRAKILPPFLRDPAAASTALPRAPSRAPDLSECLDGGPGRCQRATPGHGGTEASPGSGPGASSGVAVTPLVVSGKGAKWCACLSVVVPLPAQVVQVSPVVSPRWPSRAVGIAVSGGADGGRAA